MLSKAVRIIVVAFLLAGMAVLVSCEREKVLNPDEQTIADKTYELFTRVRARDYRVIYDLELPYFREEKSFDEFVNSHWVKTYNPDTILSCQIDSFQFIEDTAWAFMQMEYRLGDGSLYNPAPKVIWVKIDDEWYKPSLSRVANQQEFEEELRIYWEAVEALQKKQSEQDTIQEGEE